MAGVASAASGCVWRGRRGRCHGGGGTSPWQVGGRGWLARLHRRPCRIQGEGRDGGGRPPTATGRWHHCLARRHVQDSHRAVGAAGQQAHAVA
jgi:hypothetical protein